MPSRLRGQLRAFVPSWSPQTRLPQRLKEHEGNRRKKTDGSDCLLTEPQLRGKPSCLRVFVVNSVPSRLRGHHKHDYHKDSKNTKRIEESKLMEAIAFSRSRNFVANLRAFAPSWSTPCLRAFVVTKDTLRAFVVNSMGVRRRVSRRVRLGYRATGPWPLWPARRHLLRRRNERKRLGYGYSCVGPSSGRAKRRRSRRA